MAIRKTVRRGDSLWNLANRYLGSGLRYPEIVEANNKEAARFGRQSRLIAIKDPNLIFVGQTIIIPSRTRKQQGGNGKKQQADQSAKGLRVKVEYETAKDSKTWHYKTVTPDYTIEASMTAKIGIENLSRNRYQYNFGLVTSKDKIEIDQKLNDFPNKAFRDLTDGVKMTYESGQVTIKAPIATHANVGPYTLRVKADAPNHFSGAVKFEPLKGEVDKEQRKFAYTADVEFLVEVTVHLTPKRIPEETAKHRAPDKGKAEEWTSNHSINWTKAAQAVGDFLVNVSILIIGTLSFQARVAATAGTTTSTMPMMYRLDLNDPRYGSKYPGMI